MNFNAKSTGSTRNKTKLSQQILVIIVIALVFIGVFAMVHVQTADLRNTVDILIFKNAVQQEGMITEDNIQSRKMFVAEYELANGAIQKGNENKYQGIVLWEDRSKIIGAYASHYIRENTPVYWDSLTKTTTKKNSYLYKMDGELIKLDISANVFGEMIVPGDRVNIRCRYQETNYNIPTVEEYAAMQELGISEQTTVEKQKLLFSGVSILDMLNGSGESIFDKYYTFINLPIAQQEAALKSSDFKTATTPSEILLCVTAEEADMYMELQTKSPTYMLTLLPRESSNLILDALSELQSDNGF